MCVDLEGVKKVIGDRILLVDEAHGGINYFYSKAGKSAMESGADMSIISLHKGLGGPWGKGVLLNSKTS